MARFNHKFPFVDIVAGVPYLLQITLEMPLLSGLKISYSGLYSGWELMFLVEYEYVLPVSVNYCIVSIVLV